MYQNRSIDWGAVNDELYNNVSQFIQFEALLGKYLAKREAMEEDEADRWLIAPKPQTIIPPNKLNRTALDMMRESQIDADIRYRRGIAMKEYLSEALFREGCPFKHADEYIFY